MFIQTTNGRRVYGMGTALDCGGAIKGNIVDLWFPTKADCYSWGRRNVTVYILDKRQAKSMAPAGPCSFFTRSPRCEPGAAFLFSVVHVQQRVTLFLAVLPE